MQTQSIGESSWAFEDSIDVPELPTPRQWKSYVVYERVHVGVNGAKSKLSIILPGINEEIEDLMISLHCRLHVQTMAEIGAAGNAVLTARQLKILALYSEGKKTIVISESVSASESLVHLEFKRIKQILGAKNKNDLKKIMLKYGKNI